MALLHTNLLGTMLTCRAALRSMLHTQGAAIVNIGTVCLSGISFMFSDWSLGGAVHHCYSITEASA